MNRVTLTSHYHIVHCLHSQGQFQSQDQGHEDSKHHYQCEGHSPTGMNV